MQLVNGENERWEFIVIVDTFFTHAQAVFSSRLSDAPKNKKIKKNPNDLFEIVCLSEYGFRLPLNRPKFVHAKIELDHFARSMKIFSRCLESLAANILICFCLQVALKCNENVRRKYCTVCPNVRMLQQT